MTYKTIDWVAEAERVRRAFGIEEECEFKFNRNRMELKHNNWWPEVNGAIIFISFFDDRKSFAVCDDRESSSCAIFTEKEPDVFRSNSEVSAPQLAKALCHLSLLTAEVETALGVSISAHQKLEWELEYAERWGEGAMV